jgi:hypothetical protein
MVYFKIKNGHTHIKIVKIKQGGDHYKRLFLYVFWKLDFGGQIFWFVDYVAGASVL